MEKKIKINYSLKEFSIDILYDIIGSIFYAIAIYTFASNANFAPGGVSGVAIIVNHLTPIPIGIASVIINIPIILLTYKTLGRKFFLKTIKTIIINTIFIDLIFPMFPTYSGDPFLACIFTGVFFGAGCAFPYMRGSSTGGIDFVILALRKKHPHMTIGKISLIVNMIVVVSGGFVFNSIDAVLFGVISTFIDASFVDRIMFGLGNGGKLINIIVKKGNGSKVAKAISDKTERGATLIPAIGTYTKEERDMVVCACSRRQFYIIKKAVNEVDNKALVMIQESSEIFGEGFGRLEDED